MSGDMYGRTGQEIRHLIEAGIAPLDALESATAIGPDTIGPQAPLSGHLKEDYDADVIALDFDPLQDWAPWGDPDRVTYVWKTGTKVKG